MRLFSSGIVMFVLCGSIVLQQAVADQGSKSRGQRWIEANPFTINAFIETPFNPRVHNAIGFSSAMGVYVPGSKLSDQIFSAAASNELKTHIFYRWNEKVEDDAFLKGLKEFRSKHPGIVGISVGDENIPAAFERLGPLLEKVRKIAPDALVYHAMRGIDIQKEYILPGHYETYVDQAISRLKPDVLMFNMYPFYRKGLAEHFFRNLEVVTSKARKAGVPCFNWLQGFAFLETDKWPHQPPSESEIRFQAFVSLAYGCKGLSYWTYASHYHPYGQSIIDRSGGISPIGKSIQRVIPEIKTLGEKMKVLADKGAYYCPSSYHNGKEWIKHIPHGVRVLTKESLPIVRKVDVSDGKWGFLIGVFEDEDGGLYLMVVNCNHGYKKSAMETAGAITIQLSDQVQSLSRVGRNTGVLEDLQLYGNTLSHYVLPGGTGELFRVNLK